MADGYQLARPLALQLEKLHRKSSGETVLDDGTIIVIKHAGYAALSYEVSPKVTAGTEPAWLISATDDGMMNPEELPFMFVSRGEVSWTVGDSDDVPEWARSLLANFILLHKNSTVRNDGAVGGGKD